MLRTSAEGFAVARADSDVALEHATTSTAQSGAELRPNMMPALRFLAAEVKPETCAFGLARAVTELRRRRPPGCAQPISKT